MMNEFSIDVSCSYQTNYVVEIATNVIAEDQSVDLDEHDGEFQFGIMVRTVYFMGCYGQGENLEKSKQGLWAIIYGFILISFSF